MAYNWVSVLGQFEQEDETVVFKGGKTTTNDGRLIHSVGNYICDQYFGGGVVSGQIKFVSSVEVEACEFVLYYHPSNQAFTTAGIGALRLCSVRSWTGDKWITHATVGERTELRVNHLYNLRVSVQGSQVTVTIDGIDALIATLPFSLPRGQTGIWCVGGSDIRISNYKVTRERPRVFVVMQFTPPYNESL